MTALVWSRHIWKGFQTGGNCVNSSSNCLLLCAMKALLAGGCEAGWKLQDGGFQGFAHNNQGMRGFGKAATGLSQVQLLQVQRFGGFFSLGWATPNPLYGQFERQGKRMLAKHPAVIEAKGEEWNEFKDEMEDDDDFEDGDEDIEYGEDEDFWEDDVIQDPVAGDGEDGGGMALGDADWGEKALTLALETVESSFNGDFSLYAFKLSKNTGLIRVRLDKMSDKYGSPTLDDIEKFSSIYGKRLEEEGLAGNLPDNLALEVSSPGAERVVGIPHDLERFKELPMYVRYTEAAGEEDVEKDAILQLDRVVTDKAVWKLANVRANRELSGKGRPLNKKQKEWRLEVPFSSTKLVRLYLDV